MSNIQKRIRMNLWQQFEKANCEQSNPGISFRYEKGIDQGLREFYLRFSKWLRGKYVFPVHLTIYVLNQEKVRLRDGTLTYGSFRWYPKRSPRIKVPSKVEAELLEEYSLADIYVMILSSLVHELSHYFQWVADLEQTNAVSERQANYYRFRIIDLFFDETTYNHKLFDRKENAQDAMHSDKSSI